MTGEMELSFLGHFFKEQINNTKFLTGRMEVSFLGKILIGDFLFGIVFESQNTKNWNNLMGNIQKRKYFDGKIQKNCN